MRWKMARTLLYSDLYSHPGVYLEDHLINAANAVEFFLAEKDFAEKEKLSAVARQITLAHDLGKATSFFQEYLLAEENNIKATKGDLTHHSLLSAVCGYYLVKSLFEEGILPEDRMYPLMAFMAINRHHGDLMDVDEEVVVNVCEKKIALLKKQLEAISESKLTILVDHLFAAGLNLRLKKSMIFEWLENIKPELKAYRSLIKESKNPENYLKLNFLSSLLFDADKSEVVLKDKLKELRQVINFPVEMVANYKRQQQYSETRLNALREQAFAEIASSELDLNQRIYHLTLPTGLGKTLAGFNFALKLREKVVSGGLSFPPRLFYCLPFLSIIDQNAEIFGEILAGNRLPFSSEVLLVHHHLSDYTYKRQDQENVEGDEAKILIEGWNSEIIVTTFMQLFNALITNRNKSLRRFHRLANSIIVLDEIQAVPVKYYRLIQELLEKFLSEYNAYLLIMTATQPGIFNPEQVKELTRRERYFTGVDRITLTPLLEKRQTLDELFEKFAPQVAKKRALFILNTVKGAKGFYQKLKIIDNQAVCLTTHLVPKERLRRIVAIRNGEYRSAVTTQLVEAGVDIDFEMVIRDLAPFDSISQSAGRCNRNAREDKGEIFVVSLKNEKGERYCDFIYDSVLLDITEELLKKSGKTTETQLLQLMEQYFAEVTQRKSAQKSREILEAVYQLRYAQEEPEKTCIKDFALIEKDYPKIEVFVELDKEAQEIWQQYQAVWQLKGRWERKTAYQKIKNKFNQYVVAVPEHVPNQPPEVNGFHYVGIAQLGEYYDQETGFKVDSGDLTAW